MKSFLYKVLLYTVVAALFAGLVYSQEGEGEGRRGNRGEKGGSADSSANGSGKEQQLAKVAILAFRNDTGSENYSYLTGSLANAIDSSMQKNFQYLRIPPEEANSKWEAVLREAAEADEAAGSGSKEDEEKAQKKAQKEEKKEAKKEDRDIMGDGLGIADGEGKKERQELRHMQELAGRIGADIVIYGNFTHDPELNEIVFNVSMYLAGTESSKAVPETRNVLDGTIFKATEKVGNTIVADIFEMIEDSKKRSEGEVEQVEGEKTALTIDSAVDRLSWNSKKFDFSLKAGSYLSPQMVDPYEIGALMGSFRFYLNSGFFVGTRGGFQSFSHTNDEGTTELGVFLGALSAGYAYRMNKQVQLFGQLNAGYYAGELRKFYEGFDDSQATVQNPYYGARLGIDILFLPYLYVGMGIEGNVLYDDPTPMESYGFDVQVGVTF